MSFVVIEQYLDKDGSQVIMSVYGPYDDEKQANDFACSITNDDRPFYTATYEEMVDEDGTTSVITPTAKLREELALAKLERDWYKTRLGRLLCGTTWQ